MSTCIACGSKKVGKGWGCRIHDTFVEHQQPLLWEPDQYGMLCFHCAQTTADARNAAIRNGTPVEQTYTMMEAKR